MDNWSDKKIVACPLSHDEYGTLSLWCAVNAVNRAGLVYSLVQKWVADVDEKQLANRLQIKLREEWLQTAAKMLSETFTVKQERLKKYKKQKRIELQGMGIKKDIISKALNW